MYKKKNTYIYTKITIYNTIYSESLVGVLVAEGPAPPPGYPPRGIRDLVGDDARPPLHDAAHLKNRNTLRI